MHIELVVSAILTLLGLRMVFYAERCQEPITAWHNRIRHATLISPTLLRLTGRHYEWLFRLVGFLFLAAAAALSLHVAMVWQPQ